MNKTSWALLAVILLILSLIVMFQGAAIAGFEESKIVDGLATALLLLIIVFILAAFVLNLVEVEDVGRPTELTEKGEYRILGYWHEGTDKWFFLLKKIWKTRKGEVREGEVISRFVPHGFVDDDQIKGFRPEILQLMVDGRFRKAILCLAEEQEEASDA